LRRTPRRPCRPSSARTRRRVSVTRLQPCLPTPRQRPSRNAHEAAQTARKLSDEHHRAHRHGDPATQRRVAAERELKRLAAEASATFEFVKQQAAGRCCGQATPADDQRQRSCRPTARRSAGPARGSAASARRRPRSPLAGRAGQPGRRPLSAGVPMPISRAQARAISRSAGARVRRRCDRRSPSSR